MNTPQTSRVDWVDYAKGFCIVMVVMMHSTLGVEQAAGHEGWMHAVVAFARPFRMPDFFLISGLFLARVIDRDWRDYLDKQGRPLRLFLCAVGDDPVRLQGADVRGRDGLARRRLRLSRSLHRAVRHAVVHLSAADLLRRREGDARPAVAGDLARRRGAGNRPHQHRLDRDRRVRQPLRLFLHRLYFRDAHLRPRRRACSASRCMRWPALAVWALVNGALVLAGYADLPFVSLRARALSAPAPWSRSRR